MLQLLKPYDIGEKKVRLGPKTPGEHNHGDGGYVAPVNILEKSVALFTYGVAHDWRYEQEYADTYKKPVYMFDHTVDHAAEPGPGLFFKKEGLGSGENCKDFVQHYIDYKMSGDVLLKIDAEGAEFDYFINATLPYIAACTTGIILEVHWLNDENNRKKFVTIMDKLLEYYVVNHVHANNWGGTFNYIEQLTASKFNGYVAPCVVELTFVNKRYVRKMVPDNQTYPIPGLDLPNNASPGQKDITLDFLNDF